MDERLAPKAVFLTGAGLSADSGIRTYRGADGYYSGMRAEDLMSARTMKDNPERVHRFCDDRRREMAGYLPNEAHRAIARLAADYGDRVMHLTQNIDCMMEACDGHSSTIHLHGFLTRMRSIGNSHVVEDIGFTRYWDGLPEEAPSRGFRFRCPKSNSLFRPDVVLFGEMAPAYSKLWKAIKGLRRQDVLVVVGTQGVVLPVNQFAAGAPCFKILNNLDLGPDIDGDLFDSVLYEKAAVAAAEIESVVRERLGKPASAPHVEFGIAG